MTHQNPTITLFQNTETLNLAQCHSSIYNLKRSASSPGDKYWRFTDADLQSLPDRVDLRDSPFMPAVYDQGHLGSCTANAIAAAIQFDERKQGAPKSSLVPSRLFIYFNERYREGHVGEDSGASLRDGIEAVTQQGYCYENVWPYSDDVERATTMPSLQCYDIAKDHRVLQYKRVNSTIDDIRAVLASQVPVIIGLQYFPQLYQGQPQLPQPGGHAFLLVGYDMQKDGGNFIMRNSWGQGWGEGGYGYLPFEWIVREGEENILLDSLWTLERVTNYNKSDMGSSLQSISMEHNGSAGLLGLGFKEQFIIIFFFIIFSII